MNLIDIVLAIILLVGLIRGLIRGLIGEVVGFIGVIGGAGLALYLAPQATTMASVWLPPPLAYAAALAVIFAVTLVAIRLAGGLLTRLTNRTPLGPINRILGGGVGLFKAGILALLLLALLHQVPGTEGVRSRSRMAPLGQRFAALAERNLHRLPQLRGKIRQPVPPPTSTAAPESL